MKLQRLVKEMRKGFVGENMSPRVIAMQFVTKKDRTRTMSIDCRAINNITVKYHHPIPRSNDVLDELLKSFIN